MMKTKIPKNPPRIEFLRLDPERNADIPLPTYMTRHAAGMDIFAAVEKHLTIPAGEIALIPTGFAMAIPVGFEAQIRPRSGLAVNYGIGLINSPGTIDADYRGEVKIALINLSRKGYTVVRGDRIAQMVIHRVARVQAILVERLSDTERNDGGFGHTGR
jgi:dUTP pyrophosphatase